MKSHEMLEWYESFIEQKRQRLQAARAIVEQEERDLPPLEAVWAILTAEFEARAERAEHVAARNGQHHIDRIDPIKKTAQMALLVKQAGTIHVDDLLKMMHNLGIQTTIGSITTTMSKLYHRGEVRRVATGTYQWLEKSAQN